MCSFAVKYRRERERFYRFLEDSPRDVPRFQCLSLSDTRVSIFCPLRTLNNNDDHVILERG